MAAAGIVLVAIVCAGLAYLVFQSGSELPPDSVFSSGNELASGLVVAARLNQGVVELSPKGRVCVFPGTGFGRISAARLFPNAALLLEGDKSEGVWYLAIDAGAHVEVYEINHMIVRWDVEQDSKFASMPVEDMLMCPDTIVIGFEEDGPVVRDFME